MSDYLGYFFSYAYDLPDDVKRFEYFGPWHLFWLFLLAGLCLVLCPLFRKIPESKQIKAGRTLSVCIIILEICNDCILIWLGEFGVQYLPLHLCSISMFICLIHAFTGADWAGQVLYSICIPGAAAALLFPGWRQCPALNYECIHSFLLHDLLILYPVTALAAGRIKPRMKSIYKPLLYLLAVSIPLYFLNHIWGTNFMFINWPMSDSPLEWIASFMGNPGYLAGYAVLVVCIVFIMYIPAEIARNITRKKRLNKQS